jgi:hypothetical protein
MAIDHAKPGEVIQLLLGGDRGGAQESHRRSVAALDKFDRAALRGIALTENQYRLFA